MPNRRRKTSFSRRAPRLYEATAVLILCAGQTEKEYFNGMKKALTLRSVLTVAVEQTNKKLATYAQKMREERARKGAEYNEIYCVFDADDVKNYTQEIEELKSSGFKPIGSSPCFEYWVLLHFEQTTAPYHKCGDIITRIKRKYCPQYKKADPRLYDLLHGKTRTAKERAKQIKGKHGETQIHKLVEALEVIAQENQR